MICIYTENIYTTLVSENFLCGRVLPRGGLTQLSDNVSLTCGPITKLIASMLHSIVYTAISEHASETSSLLGSLRFGVCQNSLAG